MKLEVLEEGLQISPETYQDYAFLELKLGLKKDGDFLLMSRKDAHGKCFFLSSMIEAKPREFVHVECDSR